MSQIQCFENSMFGRVRVIERDGEPWFVAKDVCECLGIANPRDAVSRLDDDEKGVGKADTLGGSQDVALVSESGLYALIMRSNKPDAKAFRKWVTAEVLPSIRKNGVYALAPKTYVEALRALANEVEQKELAIKQRDEAVRTKTHIVEGRDAEMCGRVGGLTRENNVLKDAVGRGRNWQTVSMMSAEWVRRFGHKPDWRKLKEFCVEVAIEPIRDVEEKIIHSNGVEKVVKSYRYHKDAWARYERYEELLSVQG